MELIQAIVYGIVQGLTEFLPISSNAHLIIVPDLLGWKDPGAAYVAVIQLGTLAAVLIYFWKDLKGAFLAWAKSLGDKEASKTHEAKMGWAIVIGTIPVVVFGLLLKKHIEAEWRSLYYIAYAFIGVGLLMAAADYLGKKARSLDHVQPMDGLVIGLWQCLALIPGSSRSGSTITGGLFHGFDRSTAARFSFLLSVPAVFAAGAKEFWDYRREILHGHMGLSVLVATVVSFIVGYFVIGWLIKYLQTRSTMVFVVYRILMGIFIIVGLSQGFLHDSKPDAKTDSTVVTMRR